MHLLLMFINGVILENALTLRLAFLIIPSNCSLKLSLLSTLIHNSFLQLLFLVLKESICIDIFSFLLTITWHLSWFAFIWLSANHLNNLTEAVSSLLITSTIVSAISICLLIVFLFVCFNTRTFHKYITLRVYCITWNTETRTLRVEDVTHSFLVSRD